MGSVPFNDQLFSKRLLFSFFFVLLLWRLSKLSSFKVTLFWRFVITASFAYGFLFGYMFPLAQQLENSAFGKEFKDIQAFLKKKVDTNADIRIWIPSTSQCR